MNFRTTYILLGLVIASLVALAIVVLTGKDEKPSLSTEGYLLKSLRAAGVKPDDVSAVEIEMPGKSPDKITFAKSEKGWQITAPAQARADGAAIDTLVSSILNAKTEPNADIGPNLATHGLDNPAVKLTLRGKSVADTISLGNTTIGGDQAVVYVTTTDQSQKAMAVRRTAFRGLFKERREVRDPLNKDKEPEDPAKTATNAGQLVKSLTEFRPVEMLGVGLSDPTSQVQSAAVRGPDGDQIAVFRMPDGSWKFREPNDFGDANTEPDAPGVDPKEPKVQITSVRQLLNTMREVRPGDHGQIIETPASLVKYGLDPAKNKPMQLDLSRADGTKETLYVGDAVKDNDKDRYYARHESDTIVAEVNATAVRDLQRALKAKYLLRDRSVVRLNQGRVDAIDILTNGETISLRNMLGQWKIFDASGAERPARKQAVEELLTRLGTKNLATGFPPAITPEDKMGFAKPVAEIKIWEAGIQKDVDAKGAPKVAAVPTFRVLLGHKDIGNVVFGRRMTGEAKADFFVPQDVADLATRNRLSYLATSLKSFTADRVRKIAFTKGKDLYELERPDDDKPVNQAAWKINGPESMKGRAADPLKVADLINQMAFLSLGSPKLAADKPTEEVLNRLELNPARLKVTLTVKEMGEVIYHFGGDVGTEKRQVYLKPSDQDLVFEVERTAFDNFQRADIEDTVVHKIDKVKLKGVKVTGWQDIDGTPKTVEIERKDGKWSLKSGGMFELDPIKVDLFLNDLTTPRAEAFLVRKTGAKPEHNLDIAKGAMEIVLTQETGDPVTLILSAPTKDGKVIATSSLSPGDVFTLIDKFAVWRAKPAALKKD